LPEEFGFTILDKLRADARRFVHRPFWRHQWHKRFGNLPRDAVATAMIRLEIDEGSFSVCFRALALNVTAKDISKP